jgi:hypothetical protein
MSADHAVCPFCGQVRAGRSVTLTSGIGSMGTIRPTNRRCVCGGSFTVEEATDAEREEWVRRLSETPDGRDLLRQLSEVLTRRLEEGADVEQLRREVAEQSPEAARLVPKVSNAVLAFAGAMALAASAPIAARGGGAIADRLFGPHDKPAGVTTHIDMPDDSEGTVTYPDGTIVRWGEGARTTTSTDPCQDRPQPQHQDDDPE